MFTVRATPRSWTGFPWRQTRNRQNLRRRLGDWYANALFQKPQVAMLVNQRTLFPVVMRLAPAASLTGRFPGALAAVLASLGAPSRFIDAEVAEMNDGRYAKTAGRSILGTMNDFAYLADTCRHQGDALDLVELSLWLAQTPCGPLHRHHVSADRELDALVDQWLEATSGPGHQLGRRFG